jgi:hypothetical protein
MLKKIQNDISIYLSVTSLFFDIKLNVTECHRIVCLLYQFVNSETSLTQFDSIRL